MIGPTFDALRPQTADTLQLNALHGIHNMMYIQIDKEWMTM